MTEKTLHEAVQEHLEYLKGQGKSERTLYTYSKDLEQVEAFFGPGKKLSAILIPHVSGFLKSDALLKIRKLSPAPNSENAIQLAYMLAVEREMDAFTLDRGLDNVRKGRRNGSRQGKPM